MTTSNDFSAYFNDVVDSCLDGAYSRLFERAVRVRRR